MCLGFYRLLYLVLLGGSWVYSSMQELRRSDRHLPLLPRACSSRPCLLASYSLHLEFIRGKRFHGELVHGFRGIALVVCYLQCTRTAWATSTILWLLGNGCSIILAMCQFLYGLGMTLLLPLKINQARFLTPRQKYLLESRVEARGTGGTGQSKHWDR